MDVWQILMTPFSWLLKQFCLVFNSYGVALILFTVIIKFVMAPFQLKSKKSMIQMNLLSAQQREIQAKYANNPQKQNEEMQKLYMDNGVNPMGGCLWSLIPMFILFPLYAIIRRPMKYMMWLTEAATTAVATALGVENFNPAMGTSELILASELTEGNLAAASAAAGSDNLFLINFNFLGLDLSQIPSWKFWEGGISWSSVGLFLMVILSAVLAVVSMVVLNKTNQMNQGQQQNANASQNMMMYVVQPLMSLWIGFTLPAGLCIYWISNSVLTMVQEIIMGRMLREDYRKAQELMAEQAAKAKAAEKERRRLAAEKKAAALAEKKSGKKKPAGKKEEPEGPVIDKSASRIGMRQYARGRAYDPQRYPVTPYRDPNGPPKPAQPEELTQEEKEILSQDAAGKALLEQAEAPAVPETENIAGQSTDTPIYEKPEYDRPDYDHETKE